MIEPGVVTDASSLGGIFCKPIIVRRDYVDLNARTRKQMLEETRKREFGAVADNPLERLLVGGRDKILGCVYDAFSHRNRHLDRVEGALEVERSLPCRETGPRKPPYSGVGTVDLYRLG